jgi:hypothetical protein
VATNEASPDESDGISAEAFQRIQHENAQLKEQVGQLSKTVEDLGLVDLARKRFADQGVPPDKVDWLAHKVLPDIPRDEDDPEKRWAKVDEAWAPVLADFTTAPQAQSQPDLTSPPMPDAAEPPGFARPSPAADGQPVGPTKIRPTTRTPEGRALLDGGIEAVKAADKAGLIEWRTEATPTPGVGPT